ncbi:hypothetical protein JTB14_004969 [Gonioctena quinquepunctata]|nr:hypothetical protein JTB14_004969 [Gonioctena quinquepunctata]
MLGKCFQCETDCVLKDNETEISGCPCDQCKRIICKNCAELSALEVRAVVIPTRVMPFYCPPCRINSITSLGLRINKLEEEIQNYSSNLNGKLVTLEQRILKDTLESNKKLEERIVRIRNILNQTS